MLVLPPSGHVDWFHTFNVLISPEDGKLENGHIYQLCNILMKWKVYHLCEKLLQIFPIIY